jgi:hypothetical protein
MIEKIFAIVIMPLLVGFAIGAILDGIYSKSKEPEPKKLYFEFRKKDKRVTFDGFLRYEGKWCPIVLNDSIAIIYE